MFYDIKSIFNYWKIYINNFVVSITKSIIILDELSLQYTKNNISFETYTKTFTYLTTNNVKLKKEYFNVKKIKSRRKYQLIKDFNDTLSTIENEHKLYIDNLQSSV